MKNKPMMRMLAIGFRHKFQEGFFHGKHGFAWRKPSAI
jgi:hypothetical protein